MPVILVKERLLMTDFDDHTNTLHDFAATATSKAQMMREQTQAEKDKLEKVKEELRVACSATSTTIDVESVVQDYKHELAIFISAANNDMET